MRKLLWISLGFAAACAAAVYLLPADTVPWCALDAALLGMVGIAVRGRTGKRIMLFMFSAAAAFLWSWGYSAVLAGPTLEFVGQKRSVEVRISTWPTQRDNYTSVEARVTDDSLPNTRILIYDYSGAMGELRPGDEVRFGLKLTAADRRYGEDSDYYYANGIFQRGYVTDGYTLEGRWRFSWLYFPASIAETVKTQALELFPEDTAAFMKALLTGDRTEYYDNEQLYCDMRTAGLSHVIAVSGMHVAFLVGLLTLFTGRKRKTAVIGVPMIVVFMAMVGFTPSVVRAGVMQIILLLAPLLRRENDPVSALSFTLLLLLAANPFAVASVSLQLSFSAMAGIILVSPGIYFGLMHDRAGEPRFKGKAAARAASGASAVISSSLGAAVFTTPLSAAYFGYIALYSVAVNLLCLWAVSAAFVLGYISCIVGFVLPWAGRALAWATSWLARYVAAVAFFTARLPFSALYTRGNLGGWWLALSYALFAACILLRRKKRFRPLISVSMSAAGLALILLLTIYGGRTRRELCMLDVGQGQSIVLTDKGTSVVIDCGGSAAENAGDLAAAHLLSSGQSSLDALVLTHLHSDHADGVTRLICRMDVKRIIMPIDCGDAEYYDDIIDCCVRRGVEIIFVEENCDISVGELRLRVYAPIGGGSMNELGLIIEGSLGPLDFLVTGDADESVEQALVNRYELNEADVLAVGHHGSKHSTCEDLLDEVKPRLALISVGVNSYGHPAGEVLERLGERGTEIRRTDEEGDILITVVGEDG